MKKSSKKNTNFIVSLIVSSTSFFLLSQFALVSNSSQVHYQLNELNADNNNAANRIEKIKYAQQNVRTINNQTKGDFKALLEALGELESGLPSGNPGQYQVENTLGFIGKYQFGEALLIDLGYYQADVYYTNNPNGPDRNYWRGTWTGKDGIYSKSDFLNSPQVQELAIRQAFKLNLERINRILAGRGKSLNNYLGQSKTFVDRGQSKTISISVSGILAAAHLRGPYGVANLLVENQVSYDEYGTSILRYLDEYSNYTVTRSDLNL